MVTVFRSIGIALCFMLQFSSASAAEVVSADTLQKWHVEKANGGPTFSGSPAWLAHMAFVEAALRERGVVDLEREEIDYRRWFASDDPDADDRALTIDGRQVSVASYWAYSGSTDADGVTAPLIYYQRNMPAEAMQDRIVVFDVSTVPGSPIPAWSRRCSTCSKMLFLETTSWTTFPSRRLPPATCCRSRRGKSRKQD